MDSQTPYCGAAPLPAQLAGSWNDDPMLIAVLILATLALWQRRDGRRLRLAGMALLAVAFVSPLCALASALFSARVLHHVLIVAIAAPLLAAGLRWRFGGSAAFMAHMAVLWLWHMPGPYAFALSSDLAYWAMQASLLGTAVWLWSGMFGGDAGRSIGLSLGTLLQMGMLGALITFATRPLYAAHFLTTEPYGLTVMEDQQLAGLLMWVPAALPYMGFALWRLMTAVLPPVRT